MIYAVVFVFTARRQFAKNYVYTTLFIKNTIKKKNCQSANLYRMLCGFFLKKNYQSEMISFGATFLLQSDVKYLWAGNFSF